MSENTDEINMVVEETETSSKGNAALSKEEETSSGRNGALSTAKEEETSSNGSYSLSKDAYVTDIVKEKNLSKMPHLQVYLKSMVENHVLIPINVHERYFYENLDDNRPLYVAVAYKYILQREIYRRKRENPYDYQAACIEECYNYLMTIRELDSRTKAIKSRTLTSHKKILINYVESCLDLVGMLVRSYQEFKKQENDTLDILEHVYNTSMLQMVYFGNPFLPYDSVKLNVENVKSILGYANEIQDLDHIIISPNLNNKYYKAYGDLILNNAIFGMKTSMYDYLPQESDYERKLYQLILYALALYIDRKKEIKVFKIYNPLLGMEYFMEIPELDFEKLLNIVEECSSH